MLAAKLAMYLQSFLTRVSVSAVSHMLQCYLQGVEVIIHVASNLLGTDCKFELTSLLHCHVGVSLLAFSVTCSRFLHLCGILYALMCV